MSSEELIAIEIVYAEPELQVLLNIKLPSTTTVFDAVVQSGIIEKYPQIDLSTQALGIFGKTVRKAKEQQIKQGDRIEIYRPVENVLD